ncbi:hypothetical protein ACP70R_045209 [Stipagrostis hirtigluma subsp. patula]
MGNEIPGLIKVWPALVGKTYQEAAAQIKKDRPDVRVEKACVGEVFRDPISNDRVRVWITANSRVFGAPQVA